MDFKIEKPAVDLGVTPFENMFLNMYVEKADGEFLKFYLLVYSDIYNLGYIDKAKIKKKLGYSEKKYQEAVKYWIDMGIFREKKDIKGENYIEIISFRAVVYGAEAEATPNEVSFNIAGRKALMFENIEEVIGRALTPADMTRIHETLDEYGQDPELVTEAFKQAKEAGNVDVKYVMGYMKTWRDQSIMTVNDLRIHQERIKLTRSNTVRTYRKNNKPINPKPEAKSFAQQAREERIRRMLEEDNK